MTNPKALWAMILGIGGMLMCVPAGIAGIGLGILAKQEIDRGMGTGKGMAITGIVCGALSVCFGVLNFIYVTRSM